MQAGSNPPPPHFDVPSTLRLPEVTSSLLPPAAGCPVPWFLWTSRLHTLFSSVAPIPSALSLWLVTLVLHVPPWYHFLSTWALSASYVRETGRHAPRQHTSSSLCPPDRTAGLPITTCSPCIRVQGLPGPDPQPVFGALPHPGSRQHLALSATWWARARFRWPEPYEREQAMCDCAALSRPSESTDCPTRRPAAWWDSASSTRHTAGALGAFSLAAGGSLPGDSVLGGALMAEPARGAWSTGAASVVADLSLCAELQARVSFHPGILSVTMSSKEIRGVGKRATQRLL